ncbi:uncharacterized protein [Pyrus communis]|uniref:uncharacterized protein n=1 Tax=Pyrus communis TaxID=23211 RepID=UPI0035C25867
MAENDDKLKPSGSMEGTTFDVNHSYYLHHSDQPGMMLVSQPLTPDNYNTWSRAMIGALKAKNKLSFVDGTFKKPEQKVAAADLHQWDRCNSLVKTWLALWDERDAAISLPDCDYNTLQHVLAFQQNQKAIKFLMGLNETFSAVKDQILLMDPLPPVNKVYSLVLRHEKQHNTTTGKTPVQEATAFAARGPDSSKKGADMKCTRCNKDNHTSADCRAHLKCDYCGWKGHTIDYCRKLKRTDLEQQRSHSKQRPRGNNVSSNLERQDLGNSFPFTPDQCKQILTMLNGNQAKANNVGKVSSLNDLSGPSFGEDDWDGD